MPSERPPIRFLLDEHYPGWLADTLTAGGIDTVALTAHRPDLRGVDDRAVLEAAIAERRVVVTEDVATFGAAIALAGSHLGVAYCHHARFPRTRQGLERSAVGSSRWRRTRRRASTSIRSSGGSPRPLADRCPRTGHFDGSATAWFVVLSARTYEPRLAYVS